MYFPYRDDTDSGAYSTVRGDTDHDSPYGAHGMNEYAHKYQTLPNTDLSARRLSLSRSHGNGPLSSMQAEHRVYETVSENPGTISNTPRHIFRQSSDYASLTGQHQSSHYETLPDSLPDDTHDHAWPSESSDEQESNLPWMAAHHDTTSPRQATDYASLQSGRLKYQLVELKTKPDSLSTINPVSTLRRRSDYELEDIDS